MKSTSNRAVRTGITKSRSGHYAPTLPSLLASLLASLDGAIAAADAAGDDETALRLVEARHLVHAADVRLDRRSREGK